MLWKDCTSPFKNEFFKVAQINRGSFFFEKGHAKVRSIAFQWNYKVECKLELVLKQVQKVLTLLTAHIQNVLPTSCSLHNLLYVCRYSHYVDSLHWALPSWASLQYKWLITI